MPNSPEPPDERRPMWVLFLLLVTTFSAAVLAWLQSDAGIRADDANIQSQYYALLSSAEIFRQGQQSAFDIATLSTHLRYAQETTVLEYSALQLKTSGNPEGATSLTELALITGARA